MNDLRLQDARWTPARFGWAWDQAWGAFMRAPGLWLKSGLLYFVVVFAPVVLHGTAWIFGDYIGGDYLLYEPFGVFPTGYLRVNIVFATLFIVLHLCSVVMMLYWSVILYRNAARAAAGLPLRWGDFFTLRDLGRGVLELLLSAVLIGASALLLVLPGLLVAALLHFAPVAVFTMERPTVGGALRASVQMVRANPAASLLVILGSVAIAVVGSAVPVGMIVTLPLSSLLVTFAFRDSVCGSAPR